MTSVIKVPVPGEDTHRPFSFSLLALSQLLFVFALTQKRSWLTYLLFGVMASIMCYVAFYTTTGNITIDNPVGSTIFTYLLMASDYLLVSDAPKELRLRGQKDLIEEHPFWERLKWALKLYASPRGIGWSHEPVALIQRPTTPVPSRSKWKWIGQQVLWVTWWVLLMDVGGIYNRWRVSTPTLTWDEVGFVVGVNTVSAVLPVFLSGASSSSNSGRMSFSIPLPCITASGSMWRYWVIKRAIGCVSYALPAISTIGNIYRVFAITSVALGVCDAEEWPPLFGSWTNAWSVRQFWGRTWHAILRHFLLSHAKLFTHNILGLKRGTIATRYVYLFSAFLLSGILHHSGERMMLGHWGGTAIYFYLAQPLAISFEAIVIRYAAALNIGINPSSRWKWRVFGYLWVWMWFSTTLDPVLSGLMIRHSDHFSLILGVWKGDWTPRVV